MRMKTWILGLLALVCVMLTPSFSFAGAGYSAPDMLIVAVANDLEAAVLTVEPQVSDLPGSGTSAEPLAYGPGEDDDDGEDVHAITLVGGPASIHAGCDGAHSPHTYFRT